MKTVRFGVIGLGLMGREFASAAARWLHLLDMDVRPEIVAICSPTLKNSDWFTENIASIQLVTKDYQDILACSDVDAVYCAVPHHLHESLYVDIVNAGKHLFGEKPFGIDKSANRRILDAVARHPEVFVRCCSQFPFFPGVQRIGEMIEKDEIGSIIEVEAGFLHSSDLNSNKPINWKRTVEFNGEYGAMGDLGMHICHVPFRAGWIPVNVRAILSNIMPSRPDGKGNRIPCETWDNATLLCETVWKDRGESFPMIMKTHRISPGQQNTWYLSILGTRKSVHFSTRNPGRLDFLPYTGDEQNWQIVETGYDSVFPTITGSIFEFGFPTRFFRCGPHIYVNGTKASGDHCSRAARLPKRRQSVIHCSRRLWNLRPRAVSLL